jgi:hypothetical protein
MDQLHQTQDHGQVDEGIPHDDDVVTISPVPVAGEVHLAGRVATSEEAADYGTYRTIVLTGTEPRQQILPYDKHRVRALIVCSGTGPVYIGSEAQCAAVAAGNIAGGGFLLPTGVSLPVGHKQPVWLIGDGSHTATVSIAQERMQT